MSQTIATPTRTRYTPEDLLAMPDGDRYELVDGELVEKPMGWKSSWIGGVLFGFLFAYCHPRRLGYLAGADASYACFPDDPGRIRKPDVSFIRAQRMPAGEIPQGHCRIAPDLAVEVVSPNDTYSEVEEKVQEYLSAGVRLVWVLDPPTKSVRIHRPDGSDAYRREADELNGEDVIPGFTCRVADLFAAPAAAQQG
jgi:Uma2 family endonuclease